MHTDPRRFLSLLIVALLFRMPVFAAEPGPPSTTTADQASSARAFPGAVGFGSHTLGGMPAQDESTQVIKVTSLAAQGPGTLREALETPGRRLIVFEVGGVINLGGPEAERSPVLRIEHPHVTIAGQTAPPPGITIIKGQILIDAHDAVVRHLRVRPGDAGQPKRSGWAPDGIATARAAYNVVIDHCSVSWAVDENITTGAHSNAQPGTSRHVTVSNCLVAEGLSHATHKKGEHSKGMLLMDGNHHICHIRNLLISNVGRNPMVSAGELVWVNNYIQNFGSGRVSYARNGGHPASQYVRQSQITGVGNVIQAGPSSASRNTLLRAGNTANRRDEPAVLLYLRDIIARQRDGQPLSSLVSVQGPNAVAASPEPLHWPADLLAMPAVDVPGHLLTHAGATPWARDAVDRRIIDLARRNAGRFIDSQEEVGGYPRYQPSSRRLKVPKDQRRLEPWLMGFESRPKPVEPGEPIEPHDLPEAGLTSRPSLRADRVDTPPRIDGATVEPLWSRPPSAERFWVMNRPMAPKVATRAWLAYDEAALYVAFRCDEPAMDRLRLAADQADGPLWEDDSVEVMIQPDPSAAGYVHLIVNAAGLLYDARGFDAKADLPGVSAQASRGVDRWGAELSIPWRSLGLEGPPESGATRVLLGRNRFAAKARGVYQFPHSWLGNHRPRRFAPLQLSDASD